MLDRNKTHNDTLTRSMLYPFANVTHLAKNPPLEIVGGEGVHVFDRSGKRYIDGQAGLWNVNVGHGREEIKAAIRDQLDKISYYSVFGGTTVTPAVELADLLCEMTAPEGMVRAFFSSGGSEAAEASFKLVRQYWRQRGQPTRTKIVSLKRAYHGVTLGALSANGTTAYREAYEPLVPGFFQVETPHLYRNPFTDDPSVEGVDRTVANTTPIWHAGRLFMTKEDGRPIELNPRTLETLGEYDFGGKLRSQTMTAHVRIDPDTRTMYFYGYEAGGLATRDFAYGVVDAAGELVREQWFEAPYAAMMHDFVVTKNYAIFPFFPMKTDLERLKAGGPHWVWDFDEETVVGIMPRDGSVEEMRWFRGPPSITFHFMNAFDDDAGVHMDFGISTMVPFPFMQRDSGLEPSLSHSKRSGIVRWSFDLNGQANSWSERPLAPAGDFPAVADKDHMKPYAIGYYQGFDPANGPPQIAGPVGIGFNTLYRVEIETGERRSYSAGPGTTLQEHVHIASAEPGHEGYLLFVVDFHATLSSQAHILSAAHPEAGPIAKIHFPMRLRNQVHGSWVPEAELPPEG